MKLRTKKYRKQNLVIKIRFFKMCNNSRFYLDSLRLTLGDPDNPLMSTLCCKLLSGE